MILWIIFLFLFGNGDQQLTPSQLAHINALKRIAAFGDAEARGPNFYSNEESGKTAEKTSEVDSTSVEASLSDSESEVKKKKKKKKGSSKETDVEKLPNQLRRTCTPCPADMLKKWKNKGIRWICGAYQRARRTFKSECMMRYRNCEDGTMFVKISSLHCPDKAYNGRHWFYVYKV